MRRIAALLLALAAPLAAQATPAAPAASAAHPDFSGTWNLDAAASGAPAGTTVQLVVTQDAKSISIKQSATTPMGPSNMAMTYHLDGPSKNSVDTPMGALDLNSTLTWDGPVLVVKTTTSVQGQTVDQTDHWSLSSDGKTLTMTVDVSVAGQTMQRKQVLTKA